MAGDLTIANVIASVVWNNDILDNFKGTNARGARFAALHAASWTCAGCGVRSLPKPEDMWGGLQVHHKDCDPNNDEDGNLLCVCPFCHGLLHLDLMLTRGLFPGRFVWAPGVDQAFFTQAAHLRAVAEERAGPLADQDPDRLDAEARLALAVRERIDSLYMSLRSLRLPGGLFLVRGVDMSLVLEERPAAFGRELGLFVRERSREERARLAHRLHGLRYLFDYRSHPSPGLYSSSPSFGLGRDWARVWIEEARTLGAMVPAGRKTPC